MRTPILDKFVDRMKEQVEILAIKGEIDELIDECDAVTRTNCGWATIPRVGYCCRLCPALASVDG